MPRPDSERCGDTQSSAKLTATRAADAALHWASRDARHCERVNFPALAIDPERLKAPASRKRGPLVGIIDQILQDDREALKNQRHTAARIFERLRDEHGYQGGYTIVREFVARQRLRQKEIFVPLVHLPGRAQVDFGEADIYLGGVKTRIH